MSNVIPLLPAQPSTVAEAVSAFLSYLSRKRRSELTTRQYEPTLRAFATSAGDRSPGSLTSAELDEGFLATWETEFVARNGRRPAIKTQRNVTLILSSL
jgi:hypothetical protein